jgi:hypothetical protein
LLDGVDQRDYLEGKSDKSARDYFFYYSGSTPSAVRYKNWKMHYTMSQPGPEGWLLPLSFEQAVFDGTLTGHDVHGHCGLAAELLTHCRRRRSSLLALRYSYSINSSALSRIDVGTSRPSALAVSENVYARRGDY